MKKRITPTQKLQEDLRIINEGMKRYKKWAHKINLNPHTIGIFLQEAYTAGFHEGIAFKFTDLPSMEDNA